VKILTSTYLQTEKSNADRNEKEETVSPIMLTVHTAYILSSIDHVHSYIAHMCNEMLHEENKSA
jgi:hypothetical protein